MAAYIVQHASPQGFFRFVSHILIYLWRHFRNNIAPHEKEYVWSQMLRDKGNAQSSKRQVLQTPRWGHGYEYYDKTLGEISNYKFYKNIQTTISEKWKDIPIAGFFGSWDPCGKPEVIQQWKNALPQIEDHIYVYPDVGHFVEEVKGEEIGCKILTILLD